MGRVENWRMVPSSPKPGAQCGKTTKNLGQFNLNIYLSVSKSVSIFSQLRGKERLSLYIRPEAPKLIRAQCALGSCGRRHRRPWSYKNQVNLWKSVLEDYNLTRPEDEPIFRQLYLNSTYQPNQVNIISHPQIPSVGVSMNSWKMWFSAGPRNFGSTFPFYKRPIFIFFTSGQSDNDLFWLSPVYFWVWVTSYPILPGQVTTDYVKDWIHL